MKEFYVEWQNVTQEKLHTFLFKLTINSSLLFVNFTCQILASKKNRSCNVNK